MLSTNQTCALVHALPSMTRLKSSRMLDVASAASIGTTNVPMPPGGTDDSLSAAARFVLIQRELKRRPLWSRGFQVPNRVGFGPLRRHVSVPVFLNWNRQ